VLILFKTSTINCFSFKHWHKKKFADEKNFNQSFGLECEVLACLLVNYRKHKIKRTTIFKALACLVGKRSLTIKTKTQKFKFFIRFTPH